MSKKISELPAVSLPLAGTELLEIVQAGVNKKIASSDLGGGSSGVSLPVVQALSSTRSLVLADINTFNVNSTTNNYTVTIDPQSTVAWTDDAEIHFLPGDTGDIVITGGAGVSVNGVVAGSVTLSTAYGAASIKRIAADSWWVGGVIGDSPTFRAITLTDGQIAFPATQVPSANANTLDDYEEGTWTPTLTFATPGNLSVAYTSQSGFYTKIGREVVLRAAVITSSFTHTTASGALLLSGIPFANSATAGSGTRGVTEWSGITKASYTHINAGVAASGTSVAFRASGSGVASGDVNAADMPTGGSVLLILNIVYMTA